MLARQASASPDPRPRRYRGTGVLWSSSYFLSDVEVEGEPVVEELDEESPDLEESADFLLSPEVPSDDADLPDEALLPPFA